MLMLQAQAKTREMIFFDNSYPFETCVVVLRCVLDVKPVLRQCRQHRASTGENNISEVCR